VVGGGGSRSGGGKGGGISRNFGSKEVRTSVGRESIKSS